ncbi:hypothetical protein ANCCEY_06146 [Ancylostoma ceylanicum]|uniref:GOLD domain-containing protein n=1 Tax=Ancylostoma ceylanicum TaxID=53326 RepID=A0A0D6LXG7_9BILA|nr:hypothetical protein ANCCEY_06146 [Ancylostoma ceylanicum]
MSRLLVLACVLATCQALYFHIAETEKKCFIEEIPDETMVTGNYKVQLYDPNTKGYGDYPNIGMHVEVKDPEDKIATKDKLNELQLRIRQLLDQVEQITKEQNYQRYREERFRQTSESTNQRVLWWSIGQTLVLVLTGAWQMRHLKGFFEAKKLV